MISLNYKLTSYSALLHDLATVFHTNVANDLLILPDEVGEGFFKAVSSPEFNALIYSFALKEDLQMKRKRETSEYYTLIFDELASPDTFELKIGQERLTDSAIRSSAIYLTSFLYDVEYILYKDISLRGLRVWLGRSWMQKYLRLTDIEDVLEKYIDLKTKNIWYKPVDPESRELLNALLETKDGTLLHYQNKILRIVEIFFDWLTSESMHLSQKSGISRSDIEAAQKIEGILTSETVSVPPTIRELSRQVAMSESKLKKVFKMVYGLPVYEYFQRNRMQKARVLLLSGNYSIKDVGYSLGYSNLSNFTLAFKKEFGRLPSEVVKEIR